eukprot:scaffold219749_cov28-Tisochrysis_lutea.AAC.2
MRVLFRPLSLKDAEERREQRLEHRRKHLCADPALPERARQRANGGRFPYRKQCNELRQHRLVRRARKLHPENGNELYCIGNEHRMWRCARSGGGELGRNVLDVKIE